MENSKKPIASEHLQERQKKIAELKAGNALSVEVFNTTMEKEKETILTNYLGIYDKAIEKTESLEIEKSKLKTGKKTYKTGKNGEFVEEQTFDEQAVRQIKKITNQLESLYTAIDKAMVVGEASNWDSLSKLLK